MSIFHGHLSISIEMWMWTIYLIAVKITVGSSIKTV